MAKKESKPAQPEEVLEETAPETAAETAPAAQPSETEQLQAQLAAEKDAYLRLAARSEAHG